MNPSFPRLEEKRLRPVNTASETSFVAAKTNQTPARVGVDTGGTFTDFVRLSGGKIVVHKQLTTPADPAVSIEAGIRKLAAGAQFDVVHGSTVATNAVLERKGARVALVVTQGFEDVIRIGRQTRPELYNIFSAPRRPIVEPDLIFGLKERVDAQGKVLVPVEAKDIDPLREPWPNAAWR